MIVDADVETTWLMLNANSIPGLALTKQGGGALNFSGIGFFDYGAIDLEAGTLGILANGALGRAVYDNTDPENPVQLWRNTINIEGDNTSLRLGHEVTADYNINLGNRATSLEALRADTATWSGDISGSGGINKIGTGAVILSGTANSYTGPTTVTQGALRAGGTNAFSPNSTYTVEPEAVLNLQGFQQTIRTLNNRGEVWLGLSSPEIAIEPNRLAINGDYHGGAGSVLYLDMGVFTDASTRRWAVSDSVFVSGSASGATEIVMVFQGQPGKVMRGEETRGTIVDPDVLKPVNDLCGAGLVFTGSFAINQQEYAFGSDENGDLIYYVANYTPEVRAAVGIDAQTFFMNKAALESTGRRLSTLRAEAKPLKKRGYEAWVNGAHREDKIRDTIYTGARHKVSGVQAGVDFLDSSSGAMFVIGALFDYLDSSMKLQNTASTDATSHGVGLYGAMRDGPWYIEAAMRATKESYRLSSTYVAPFDLDGSSFGGYVETGYAFGGDAAGWIFEPQGQLILQRSTIDSTYDPDGYYYNFKTVQSTAGRVGLRISKAFQGGSALRVTPYVRASILQEFGGDNTVTVGGTTIHDDLGGTTGIIEGGVTARFSDRVYLSADGAYYYGGKYDGFSLNFGANYSW
ncbi:MAG: autotransporter outer membrane beta-barrel domain-containing protein [Opitutaceae bacterium]|nr:autotransporter outer membrane beta-barrel domain-containing protein [Opitutaceae bacterium]